MVIQIAFTGDQVKAAAVKVTSDGERAWAFSKARVHPPSRTKAGNPVRPCPRGAAIFSDQAWGEIGRSLRLSARELQIVRGVFDDQIESGIASELGISTSTIHTHCERLYRKLAVTDRVRLVLRVMEEFLSLTIAPGTPLPPVCANRAAGRCPLRRR